ncbi:MAG: hypothetical protein MUD08_18105 [Cytophagales bacterium]|nr:hypothetical protein [Cytophagales bacterium]
MRRQNEELTKINQELDRFVYSVSHDLRAPVASALGLADLMGQETDLSELHEYNRVMEKNLRRLDRFIADILDYSRNARFDGRIHQLGRRGARDGATV